MNIIWFGVLRPLYALGLLFVAPLFALVALSGVKRQPDVAIPVLIACVAYFAAGYFVFRVAPRWLRSRLMAKVATGRPEDFAPTVEATSVLHNRYLGIDGKRRRAYFVDSDTGTRQVMDLEALEAWQVVDAARQAPLLTVSTRLPERPRFDLRLSRQDSVRVAAELAALTH
jgi:hypothetical protein